MAISPQELAQAAGIEYTPGMGYDEFQKRIAQKQAVDAMKVGPPPGLGPPPNAIKDVDTNVPLPAPPTSFKQLAVANQGPVQQKAIKLEGVPAVAPGGPAPGPGLPPPGAGGPPALDFSSLKATPATVIPGHTVATMSTEQAKADIGALQSEKQAELRGNEASIATANVANQENVGLAGVAHQQALEAQAAEARRQQELNNHFTKRKAMEDDIRSSKVDPNHFFGEGVGGVFKRIGTVLSMAMGGYAAGLRGGPNMAAQIIEDGINRDIDAQKHEIDKKRGLLDEYDKGYGQKLQQFGDQRVAEAAQRADMYSAAKALAESHIADAKTDEQRANGEKLAAHFDGKIAAEDRIINKWQPQTAVGGMTVAQKLELMQKAQNLEKGQLEMGKTKAETAKLAAQAAAGGGGGKLQGLPPSVISQLGSIDSATQALDAEIALRKNPNISRTQRQAESKKNLDLLSLEIPHAFTGQAVTPDEKQETRHNLPTDSGSASAQNFGLPFTPDAIQQLESQKLSLQHKREALMKLANEARKVGTGGGSTEE